MSRSGGRTQGFRDPHGSGDIRLVAGAWIVLVSIAIGLSALANLALASRSWEQTRSNPAPIPVAEPQREGPAEGRTGIFQPLAPPGSLQNLSSSDGTGIEPDRQPVPGRQSMLNLGPPRWVVRPSAIFPDAALRDGVEAGTATLNCVVTRTGRLDACTVVSERPTGQGFGQAALAGARQARMEPLLDQGRAIEGSVRFSLTFNQVPVVRDRHPATDIPAPEPVAPPVALNAPETPAPAATPVPDVPVE